MRATAALAGLLLAAPLSAAETAPAPAPAPATASAALAAFLSGAVGPEGLEVIGRRGYAVLQGPKTARRAAAVHWKALERLAAASKSCWALAAAADAAVSTVAARGGDISACRALPPSGVVTPDVHAMAAALTALREDGAALDAVDALPPDPDPSRNLFSKPWGRDLAARAHADLLEDPAALTRPFFDERLAAPVPTPGAAEHLAAESAGRGFEGVEVRVASDAAAGKPSDALKAQLRRHFMDERRRWNILVARAELARLRKTSGRELAELAAVAAPLSGAPGLLEKAEASASGAAGGEPPRLRSAGLHLTEPSRLGQHELGDEVLFSGAYWVDGLPEGKSAEVEETTFGETADGYFAVESRRVRRANGGPYTYARKLRLDAPGSFVARAVVSAETGNALSERVDVKVAPDFELALFREAAAAALRQSCDGKGAQESYDALLSVIEEPAKSKPQYKALAARARKAREDAGKDAARLASLEDLTAKARLASSPESCRYSVSDADAAIKLLEGLPPGCDQHRPELARLRATIARRGSDHAWFLKASADARSKRKSCDLADAARRWTDALAVLEADPAARCGKAAEEAEAAARELAETRRELAWSARFEESLSAAEAAPSPAGRLEKVRPVLARLPTLSSARCLAKTAGRAELLAKSAGEALAPAEAADLARRLPSDATLSSVAAEVRRERARLASAAETAARAAADAQAPAAPAAAPAADGAPAAPAASVEDAPAKRPAAKPARKPARKPAGKTRKPARTAAPTEASPS